MSGWGVALPTSVQQSPSMAIVTRFVRDTRFSEVPGCPLASDAVGDDNAACVSCPYNALLPGKARVGCEVHSSSAEVDAAMQALARMDEAGHTRLREILAAQRRRAENIGLSAEELQEVRRIVERWSTLCGNDVAERQVVAILQGFTERGLALEEGVLLLG